MWFKIFQVLKKIDWLLCVAVFLLILFGLSSLYSLGLSQESNFNLLTRQIIYVIIGLVLMLLFIFFDYRWWKFLSPWLYFLAIGLLTSVLFLGRNIRGTTGWFDLGIASFQPVELAKLAIILFLSRLLIGWFSDKYSFSLWFKSFLIISPVCALTLLQPDLGSTLVIFFIWFATLVLFGTNKKQLLIIFIIGVIILSVAWQFLYDYQQTRILTFLNPENDPLGAGYNVRQSIIAIGSGGFWGRGLALGTQSQLHFLPVSEADFIFSALAEELGFIGCFIIFVLYFVIFYRLFKIMREAKDDYGVLIVAGFSFMFFVQVVINIGMSVGVLPVTGLSLPFVSYGGSFLVISLISLGIIQSVKIRS